jgi:DNA topoisomerase-2
MYEDPYLMYEDPQHRWKIAVTTSKSFMSTSTVNYVNTRDGGTHVDHIAAQIRDYINDQLKNDKKKNTKAYTISQIRSHLFIVVSAIVVNPEFTDQAKTKLTTPIKDSCVIPEPLLKAFVTQTRIKDELEGKTITNLLKKARKSVKSIEKYIRANKASSAFGHQCTLFICEGLSAKTMCVTGMNIIGYDYYGVYPLRGKVLNTRKASITKYTANREIQDLISIIGLEENKEYTSTKGLNYGRIVCMKDADSDGADIMGLVMNFFENRFKSLVKLPGFFNEFITPMIQVIDKKETHDFYNEVQYKAFMEMAVGKNPHVRFIKGLASNTKQDIDKYFNNYQKYLIPILFDNNFEESLDKAFNKDRANDRKNWLRLVGPDTHLPRVQNTPIHVDEFVDKELVCYAHDACVRAIPSVIDGLKPVQRKILYTLFKDSSIHRSKEVKVFQLCGNVGKFANYHHGDASLNAAIITMAQSFPGSNNIPLVENSSDGFGSRQENGHDCGQPRYLTVKSKANVARYIFPAVDDNVLRYREEDNEVVEPVYYIPIIPLVLVNGACGIGMGWSTTIPSFSPIDCINYVRDCIHNGKSTADIKPYYKDYDGTIIEEPGKHIHHGLFEVQGNRVIVKEIPITMSISSFRDVIVKVLQLEPGEEIQVTSDSGVKSTKTNTTGYHIATVKTNKSRNINHIDMELTFNRCPPDGMTREAIGKVLHLSSSISTSNMVAFDASEHIKHYKDIYAMVSEWFEIRKECYVLRKEYLIKELEHRIKILRNRVKFIRENIDETLNYKNRTDAETDSILEAAGYEQDKDSYDYLLSMQVRSFTKAKFDKLSEELAEALKELEKLKNTTIYSMWLDDLSKLEEIL